MISILYCLAHDTPVYIFLLVPGSVSTFYYVVLCPKL